MVTNVELDHHSRWSSRAELLEAFRRFAAPAAGLRAAGGRRARPDRRRAAGRALRRRPSRARRSSLAVPGAHNVLNARAALAALELAGFERRSAARGARRASRACCAASSARGSATGPTIYDDYAHHPTEVAATLAALRELEPRRLIAVFQPHLYSRTKALGERFGAALAAADEVGVLDVYPAREQPVGRARRGQRPRRRPGGRRPRRGPAGVVAARRRDGAARALRGRLREGDLLVTIGAGDIYELASQLVDEQMPVAPPLRFQGQGPRRREVDGLPRGVERDYPLARLTTVRAGGDAELFARPRRRGELVELLALGGGRGSRGRGGRLGLEPAGRRRRRPRAWC